MEKFVEANLALLSLERETEIAESEGFVTRSLENPKELEAKGVCLQRLYVSSQRVGLYGRQVVTFEPQGKAINRHFVANTIGPGECRSRKRYPLPNSTAPSPFDVACTQRMSLCV